MQPFSLEFKPLLDDIASHERDLKELADSFTMMTTISMLPIVVEAQSYSPNTEFCR